MDFVNGRGIDLSRVKPLAEGGESIIYAVDGLAYKKWKAHVNKAVKRLKVAAAIRLRSSLPDNVFGPLNPLLNEQGDMVGFEMKRIPRDWVSLDDIRLTNAWEDHNITHEKVVRFLLKLYDLVRKLHELDVVVGDLNLKNLVFHPQAFMAGMCDVDAWQFGTAIPCLAIDTDFATPRLFGKNLATGQHRIFPQDDWWAFAILMFISLLRIHPWRAGKTGIDDPTVRYARGLTVFNPKLQYPPTRAAFPLKTLPTATLLLFDQIFNKGRVENPDQLREHLVWLSTQFRRCNNPKHTIGNSYATERGIECPVCTEDISIPNLLPTTQSTPAVRVAAPPTQQLPTSRPILPLEAVEVGSLQSWISQIVFAKPVYGTTGTERREWIFALSRDPYSNLVAHWIDPRTNKASVHTLKYPYKENQAYDANESCFIVGDGNNVQVFDYSWKRSLQLDADPYHGTPVVGLSADSLVWTRGGHLLQARLNTPRLTPEKIVPLPTGATWFAVGQTKELFLAGFLELSDTDWFVYESGRFTYLPNTPIDSLEEVVFHEDRFAVIHQTRYNIVACVYHKATLDFEEVIQKQGTGPLLRLNGRPTFVRGTLVIPTNRELMLRRKGVTTPGSPPVPNNSILVSAEGRLFALGLDGRIYKLVPKGGK